ncbi:MAG: hypothetical protein IKE24_04165 [Clostridia bacterium]|nr:hypothetical protein [Clostridia bacterium]
MEYGCKRDLKREWAKRAIASVFMILALLWAFSAEGEGFHYEHDPRQNPFAMADIVENPDAVYGFSPSREGSLAAYADFDWTDPELVNGEQGRLARIAYHESIEEMYDLLEEMILAGSSTEEMARALSAKRNEIRLAAYDDDPEGLAALKQRNLERYGHEEGPLAEELYGKYGSWEAVLDKAFSVNSGMDACLGLYDDFFMLYVAAGQVTAEDERTAGEIEVSYLGPEGTYTQEAAAYFFQDGETLIPKETVTDAIAEVVNGTADYAVIPQENTLGGAVVNYLDALISAKEVYVTGEIVLPISQTLMGVPGAKLEEIRTVCSHAQGLTQSARWREKHLPEAAAQEMASTAAAASYVAQSQDRTIAAVAAPGAAELYGLEILARNVQISDTNKTRFYVLSAHPLEGENLTRAVLIATCEANRVDDLIVTLHDAGLELVALHDRPEGSFLGSYCFVLEVENEAGITDAQLNLMSSLESVRFAGCFNAVEKGIQ